MISRWERRFRKAALAQKLDRRQQAPIRQRFSKLLSSIPGEASLSGSDLMPRNLSEGLFVR